MSLKPPDLESRLARGEAPTGRVSVEKSQEEFKTDLPAVDMDVDVPNVQLRRDVHLTGRAPGARMSVEKCEEAEQPSFAPDGNMNLSMQAPQVEVKPVSPDAHVEGKRKSGLFGSIFGKKDKKKEKEKKVRVPSTEMKVDVHVDDGQVGLDMPNISGNVDTDMQQEGVPLTPTVDTVELNIPSPDVEAKHPGNIDGDISFGAEVTAGSQDLGEVDIEMPDVQVKSQSAVHAMPELSRDQDEVGLDLNLGGVETHGSLQSPDEDVKVEVKPWDVDVNANKIFDKDADIPVGDVGAEMSLGMPVDTTAASAQVEVEKPEFSAAVESSPTGIDLTAPDVSFDAQTGKLASSADVSEPELQVNLPSGTVDADRPQITGDVDVEIPTKSSEHRVHFSDKDTCIDLPHGDVGVGVSGNDKKNKPKLWNPFKKSKKASVEAKVEAPCVSVETSNPTIDVDPQLSGDLSVMKPIGTATLDADPTVSVDVDLSLIHI